MSSQRGSCQAALRAENAHSLVRIEPQNGNCTAIGLAEALYALHRSGLSCAIGANKAEDFSLMNIERYVIYRHGGPVAFA